MAFELLQELPNGATGNYWKLSSALVSCNDNPIVTVHMELYLDRNARIAGKTALIGEFYSFPLQSIDMSYSFDFRVCLYYALRTLPKWQNAVDIFDDPNKMPVISSVSIDTSYETPGTVALYSWDPFNEPLTYIVVDQPSNGTITLNGKNCTYTPNSGFYGTDFATYKTNNGTFDSEIANISITVVDTPDRPAAYTLNVGTRFDVPTILDMQASDPNNLPLIFELVDMPNHGIVTENNGVFTYDADDGFIGTDTATFIATNGGLDSNVADINIYVSDTLKRPNANGYSGETSKNTPLVLNLTGVDNENLPLTITIVTQTTNGVISESSGVFTYTPNVNFVGSDSGSFKVSNGLYESSPVMIDIDVIE